MSLTVTLCVLSSSLHAQSTSIFLCVHLRRASFKYKRTVGKCFASPSCLVILGWIYLWWNQWHNVKQAMLLSHRTFTDDTMWEMREASHTRIHHVEQYDATTVNKHIYAYNRKRKHRRRWQRQHFYTHNANWATTKFSENSHWGFFPLVAVVVMVVVVVRVPLI